MSLIIFSKGLQKFVGFLVEQNNISGRGVEALCERNYSPSSKLLLSIFLLSPSMHIRVHQTHLHTFPSRITDILLLFLWRSKYPLLPVTVIFKS